MVAGSSLFLEEDTQEEEFLLVQRITLGLDYFF